MWYVCSDIHIGTGASREDYLYSKLIPQLMPGDTLVLLGDVWDYWFSTFDIAVGDLAVGWHTLIQALRDLRTRSIEIIYVPGNHDSFVFYNEWSRQASAPQWLTDLYASRGNFAEVRRQTTDSASLAEVASIYHPMFIKAFGSTEILFTHGHWGELAWQLVGGDPDDPFNRIDGGWFFNSWAKVKAAAVAYAYEHPQLMRTLFLGVHRLSEQFKYFVPEIFNERGRGMGGPLSKQFVDPYVNTRRAEDIFFSLVSDARREAVSDLKGSIENERQFVTHLTSLINKRMSVLEKFEGDLKQILAIARGEQLKKKWSTENNPDSEWAHAIQRLTKVFMHRIETYRIDQEGAIKHRWGRSDIDLLDLALKRLKGVEESPYLIHGHFHVPRRGAFAIDDGCMLNITAAFQICTYVKITPSGQIIGP